MTRLKRLSAIILVGITTFITGAQAQSTFGIVLGSVEDKSGAMVPKATVRLTNTDENTSRETGTNTNGDYEFVNTKSGHYKIDVTAAGFQAFTASELTLVARQTLRVDVGLSVGQLTTEVKVEESAGVITTDTQTIQSSLDGNALLTLPGNTRGAGGSTSPYSLIAALPGVQPDDNGNFSIQGGLQSMAQFSVDGISITNVGGNSPLVEAFPSMESIAEIKVQGVGNNAEFAEVGDVTTISKSGTNLFHGSLFWYHQNAALNATKFGQLTKPALVNNDFGASIGGPVVIPHVYNGKNRTFFFGTYEGLRLPQASTIQDQVPTDAMRNGDFSGSGIVVNDPTTGLPFPNNQIPASRISSVTQGFLALYPKANAGNLSSPHAANYIDNRNASINSDQYDVRVDHYLTPNMSVFGRWSWKSRGWDKPQDLAVPSEVFTDKYKMLATSWNWNLRPNLINEFRFGFTLNPFTQTLPFDGSKFTNALGLVGVGPSFPFNGLSEIDMNSYTCLCTDRGNSLSQNNTYQWNNNTTWTKGRHTLKFGFDIRRLRAVSGLGFIGGDNYGNFNFTGGFSGDAFGDFLLGLPSTTGIDTVTHDNFGLSMQYGIYAQDSFRVSQRLTLEYGVRWEFHPGYTDQFGNIGNFNPAVPKSGQVVYPDGAASTLAPLFLQSFNACPQLGSSEGPAANGAPCTPVLSASQAGLPQGLRTAPTRFVPRFGFAFRPFSNDKTVLRGGFGMYDTPSMGSIYYALTGTLQSNTLTFNNIAPTGGPIFQFPQIRTGAGNGAAPLGTAYFGTANDIHWKEPYTMQWNISIDRDLGFNTGLRVSYIGQGTRDLVYAPNLNQSYYSTTYYVSQPLSSRPFPNWGVVNDRAVGATMNYHSLQTEVTHRSHKGLTFNSSFTFAKNLSDNQGPVPDHFADENAGSRNMDTYNLKAEYGPVWGTRKYRWLTTAVYELPFGRGRQFMGNANRVADALLGGWRLSNIFLIQSGPYETPYFQNGDPSGTGAGFERSQHPDRVGNGTLSNPTANQWFDPSAFTCPASPGWTIGKPCTIGDNPSSDLSPIGRFGNAGIGLVTGPGTVNLSTALGKAFSINEKTRFKIEASFTNLFNHVNLADPKNAIDNPSFGQITSARGSDFGGYRTGQVSARIEF